MIASSASASTQPRIRTVRAVRAENRTALRRHLGAGFAPRIRDLGAPKLYIPKGDAAYDALKPMIGGTLNIKHVGAHWDEILQLATSIKQGTVTASLMLRKLGSYPRQRPQPDDGYHRAMEHDLFGASRKRLARSRPRRR